MGAYKYVEELWRRKQSDVLRFLLRVRAWEYRQVRREGSGAGTPQAQHPAPGRGRGCRARPSVRPPVRPSVRGAGPAAAAGLAPSRPRDGPVARDAAAWCCP